MAREFIIIIIIKHCIGMNWIFMFQITLSINHLCNSSSQSMQKCSMYNTQNKKIESYRYMIAIYDTLDKHFSIMIRFIFGRRHNKHIQIHRMVSKLQSHTTVETLNFKNNYLAFYVAFWLHNER